MTDAVWPMDQQTVLHEVLEVIEQGPHTAGALTLYALVSTLEFDKAGFLFKLDKLRDLDPSQRRLAYQLMELMVAGEVANATWQQSKARMDELIRGA